MAGRPKFKIDYDIVQKLAKIHCTQEEIANILGCSVDTLQRDTEFCGIYKRETETAKASLRRMQFKAAEEGNPTVLIWLGKQYLGQKEPKQEINNTNTNINQDVTNLPPEERRARIDELIRKRGN